MLNGNGNGKLSEAEAAGLIRRRVGTAAEWHGIIPVADSILDRLGLTPDQFGILLAAEKHRERPALMPPAPEPTIPARFETRVVAAVLAVEAAQREHQTALDTLLVIRAEKLDRANRGKDLEGIAEREGAVLQNFEAARAVLEKATARLMTCQQERQHARRRALLDQAS